MKQIITIILMLIVCTGLVFGAGSRFQENAQFTTINSSNFNFDGVNNWLYGNFEVDGETTLKDSVGTLDLYLSSGIDGTDTRIWIQENGVSKWLINHDGGLDDFLINNRQTTTNVFRIDNETNDITLSDDLSITGALSKGSGSFKIDNPENPLNEFLYHQFHESPEALLTYRGTDQSYNNGHGWYYDIRLIDTNKYEITFPSWFDDLTFTGSNYNEYTGHLTGIKSFCGDSYFDFDNIANNKIVVATEKNCKFSWEVQAVRHDPYYESEPMNVVVAKPETDIYEETKNIVKETDEQTGEEITKEVTTYEENRQAKGNVIHREAYDKLIPLQPKPIEKELVATEEQPIQLK